MSHFAHQSLSPRHRVIRSGRAASNLPLLALLLLVPLAAPLRDHLSITGSPRANGFHRDGREGRQPDRHGDWWIPTC